MTTLSLKRVAPTVVHAVLDYESAWRAAAQAPVSACVVDKTYRRARGQLRRLLETLLGTPVELVEHISFPPSVEARIRAFREMHEERARLEAAIRAEALNLSQLLAPRLAMTLIARELGLTDSELHWLVRTAQRRAPDEGTIGDSTPPVCVFPGDRHAAQLEHAP